MVKKSGMIVLAVLLLLATGCGKNKDSELVDGGPVSSDAQSVEDGAEAEAWQPDSGEADVQAFELSENGMTKAADKIIWVTNADYAPYEYVDENGAVVGIDADIAEYIADRMGLKLEVLDIDFDSVVDAVMVGDADIAIASLAVTEDRSAKVDFSETYMDSIQVLIVRADSEVTSARDLEGKLGVLLGSFGWQYARNNIQNAEIDRFNSRNDILNALLREEIDAAIIDVQSALVFSNESEEVKVLPDELTRECCAIAVNKRNAKLLEQINTIVREMKENGKLDEIFVKYQN